MQRRMAIGWCVLFAWMVVLAAPSLARDCRSELGAHLKPLSGSGLSWAMEVGSNQGWMDGPDVDRSLWTGLMFVGLNYQFSENSPHQLYVEAGVKDWYRSDEKPGSGGEGKDRMGAMGFGHAQKRHLGPREAFYRFDGELGSLTAGLQSMHLSDHLLLDERVLGAKWTHQRGAFQTVLLAGTVSTDFARVGDFCASRHTYRLVRGGRFDQVSSDLWQTNLAGGMISWSASHAIDSGTADFSEQAEDDFVFEDMGDEFGSLEQEGQGWINRAGILFLEEFGDGFHEYKYYYGGLVELGFPTGFRLETEILIQHIYREMALGYSMVGKRDITWSSGAFTELAAGYMGKVDIDDGSPFYPAFSNLFWGEVMRLDAPDFPLCYVRARHSFPWKMKPSIKLFLVAQTQGEDTREADLEVGLKIFKGLRFYGVSSRIESDLLVGTETMNRGEFRWAF